MTPQDHASFGETSVAEQNIRARIEQLQEYRRKGITTFAQADLYDTENKNRIATIFSKSPFVAQSDRISKIQQTNSARQTPISSPSAAPVNETAQFTSSAAPLDLTGCDGVSNLTASEQALCSQLRLLPRAYLSIKRSMLQEYAKKGSLRRREARALVRIDVNKLGKIYDYFISMGWINV